MNEVATRLIAMLWAASAAVTTGLWVHNGGSFLAGSAVFAGLMALLVAVRD